MAAGAENLNNAENTNGAAQSIDAQWGEAMKEAEKAKAQGTPARNLQAVETKPASFTQLRQERPQGGGNLELILDIPVTVSVEIGRTRMVVNDLLQLGQGSVVELEKLAGEPMEILVNGKLIARGEAVVVNEKFGVKLTDIVSPTERISKLR